MNEEILKMIKENRDIAFNMIMETRDVEFNHTLETRQMIYDRDTKNLCMMCELLSVLLKNGVISVDDMNLVLNRATKEEE